MRRPPIVLVDVDDVLCDFVGHYVKLASKAIGEKLDPEKVFTWDLTKSLSLPKWAVREIEHQLSRPEEAHLIEELPGAVAAVKEIANMADVYFVTAPYKKSRTWPADRTEWLIARFGENQGQKVIHTDHKKLVFGDFFIDDKIDNVVSWSQMQEGMPILWDRPHNRQQEVEPPIVRATEWDTVVRLVKGRT